MAINSEGDTKKDKTYAVTTFEKPLLVFNAILAAVGIGRVIIYGLQLDTSKKQLFYSQRAWIGTLRLLVDSSAPDAKNIQPNVPFTVRIRMKNFGNTPAGQAKQGINVRIFCDGFPENPPYTKTPNDFGLESQTSIMPTQEITVGPAQLDHPITDTEFHRLTNKTCGVYVYANSEYCDIFGASHYRHYCGQWLPNASRDMTIAECASYNDGDEDHRDREVVMCGNTK